MRPTILSLLIVFAASTTTLRSEDRATRVRKDLEESLAKGLWIYNDLDQGFEEARKKKRPLLVVIRCVPCESCKGFDEQVASFDPRVRKLLEKFVCVRVPQSNGLDLSLFQFDYDLSFFGFFLNADRTIYGRFGSPSTQKDKTGEVSIEAFREALEAVLKLHANYSDVKESLGAKTGGRPEYATPEEHPLLKDRYTSEIDYKNKPVKSCIHCHQIRDSERRLLRKKKKPFPDSVLYPYPLLDPFGIELDPRRRATISDVQKDSVGHRAGFRTGDELVSLAGQPLVSIADVQWVLHHAGESGELEARVQRGGLGVKLKLPLSAGWRKRSDISWRVTTWDLRRIGTGGLLLENLPDDERRRLGLAADKLALRAKHVGQYGDHATAKRAGFRKGDIIVGIDGRDAPMRETDFIAYTVQQKKPGDELRLSVLRDGKRKEMKFRLK